MSLKNISEHIQRATIIGGQGFIGRELKEYLELLGWKVWAPTKNDPEIFERDLGKVFYCAGLTADYLQRPFDTVNAHVSLLSNVLYFAKWEQLVYLSSTRVYDGLMGLVDEKMSLNVTPENPRHLYDLSKLMGESLCLQTKRASVARLACVFKDESDEDGFLPKLLRLVLDSKSNQITVESSPHLYRDYVHITDVIHALILIVESGKSEIFNVAGGENILNSEIFSLIESTCLININATQNVESLTSPQININKMNNNYGWRPQKILGIVKAIIEKRNE